MSRSITVTLRIPCKVEVAEWENAIPTDRYMPLEVTVPCHVIGAQTMTEAVERVEERLRALIEHYATWAACTGRTWRHVK